MNTISAPKPTARQVWESFVQENWTKPQWTRIGRNGMIEANNPREHLAHSLIFQSYQDGKYILACRDKHFLAWARVKLVQLGEDLSRHARVCFGIDKPISVEFVERPTHDKF